MGSGSLSRAQLAWLLGGDIAIGVSVLGKGSTFVVALPARYVAGAPPIHVSFARQPATA